MIGGRSGVDELPDPRGQVFADARNLAQLCVGDAPNRVGPGGDRFAGRAIRANLEGVVTLDFEQVGDLSKNLRDRAIIHAPDRAARRCTRESVRRLP